MPLILRLFLYKSPKRLGNSGKKSIFVKHSESKKMDRDHCVVCGL